MSKAVQKELIACIKEQDKIIMAAEREIDRLKGKLAALAPHKVGDDVGGNDYVHRGKLFRIQSVAVRHRNGSFEYCYYGKVLKKDGTLGTISTRRFDPVIAPAAKKIAK